MGIKIGVLCGGVSAEREISLQSGNEVYASLKRSGVDVVLLDIITSDPEEVKDFIIPYQLDCAFIALHGEFGEDGQIQTILEDLNIIYTGSDPQASFLAMDKIRAKELFIKDSLLTPPFYSFSSKEEIPSTFVFPVVVKPHYAGSSIGISIVDDQESLNAAIEKVFALKQKVLIEKYISGRELTVGILGNKALGVVEIVPHQGYYDFNNKYGEDTVSFFAPAQVEKEIYSSIQKVGLSAHRVLGCSGFSRVDMRLSRDNQVYVLEVNSIPGFTTHSLLPLSAKCLGINFDTLILKIVSNALAKRGKGLYVAKE